MYEFADLTATVELYGHLRASNPEADVYIKHAAELDEDDLTAHLVLLGGVDWNPTCAEMAERLGMPIRQIGMPDVGLHGQPDSGYFEATTASGKVLQYYSNIVSERGQQILETDVALFFHGRNPLNTRCTLTILNGMFGRGTYAITRALIDPKFRDHNNGYLQERFRLCESYGILSKIEIMSGMAVTPDWANPETRLFEWPGPS
jgi:hypothetical protein